MPPAGCERIRVSLKKPLGLVLEQNRASLDIFVVEVLPDGSAAKDGRIAVGDQLIATSAIVYTAEEDYGGVSVKKGMSMVRLLCKGESFDTGERPSGAVLLRSTTHSLRAAVCEVLRAIGTHPGTQPVTLDIQKCKSLKELQAEG